MTMFTDRAPLRAAKQATICKIILASPTLVHLSKASAQFLAPTKSPTRRLQQKRKLVMRPDLTIFTVRVARLGALRASICKTTLALPTLAHLTRP